MIGFRLNGIGRSPQSAAEVLPETSRPLANSDDHLRVCDNGGMTTRTRKITAVVIAAAALALPACSTTVAGNAVESSTPISSTAATTSQVAPKPVKVPTADTTPVEIPAKYNVMLDSIKQSSRDVRKFMANEGLPMNDVVIHAAMAGSDSIPQCQPVEYHSEIVAWACSDDTPRDIVFDLPHLYREVSVPYGNVGVAIVAAHEYGHLALPEMRRAADTDDRMEERRADCAAGAFMAWYS